MRESDADRFIRGHLPMIEAYFRARVSACEEAEDLMQEAAFQVLRSWSRFQHRAAASTWVYAVCRNVLSNHLRSARRHRRGQEAYESNEASLIGSRGDLWLFEDRQAVEGALDSLEPRYRELYDLRYRRGLTVGEVAERLGRPEGTVKYDLFVLRRKVRAMPEGWWTG